MGGQLLGLLLLNYEMRWQSHPSHSLAILKELRFSHQLVPIIRHHSSIWLLLLLLCHYPLLHHCLLMDALLLLLELLLLCYDLRISCH